MPIVNRGNGKGMFANADESDKWTAFYAAVANGMLASSTENTPIESKDLIRDAALVADGMFVEWQKRNRPEKGEEKER